MLTPNDFRCVAIMAITSSCLLTNAAEASDAPVIPTGQRFSCTPIAVWDGDGPIWCAEGAKIRLAGIAVRELDDSCKPGHPCPSISGVMARDQLVTLLGGATGAMREGHIKVTGPSMHCVSSGSGKGDRTAAWCVLPNGYDLSCNMVAIGAALRWVAYDRDDRCRGGSIK